MARKKKKPTKHHPDWRSILTGAFVDFIVGALLILLNKLIE